ncbi:MAG: PD-(D/E)XK nuclease family protein [Patescibacteria group bacterium]
MARKLYDNNSAEPFKLSRSKIDLFVKCPRCFYLDRKLGIARPDMPGWPINSAIDELLKREFDLHRAKGEAHPLMKHYGIDAVPFAHEKMDEWRDSLRRGIQYLHKPTGLILTGGIDDLWVKSSSELIIVDYKATSTVKEITLDDEYKGGYKRQIEIYQWLFRQNGFAVSNQAYFVFCNGKKDGASFDGKLEFDVTLVPYRGDDSWVLPVVFKIKACLESNQIPLPATDCQYCQYTNAIIKATLTPNIPAATPTP